ncbi:hypothetical protein HK100_010546, partial [Physocladia obscura]
MQIPAYADNYAFLIDGLIELFQSTHDEVWIQWASELQDTMDSLFCDAENGGYFTGIKEEEKHDGAEPTPSSTAVKSVTTGKKSFIVACDSGDKRIEHLLRTSYNPLATFVYLQDTL